jgi:cytochrome P450
MNSRVLVDRATDATPTPTSRIAFVTTTEDMHSDDMNGSSAYAMTPNRVVDLFDDARSRCPVAHSDEHGGFHMMLDHTTVRAAAADHRRYSSEPQVLRPILPRPSLAALEMDPPRRGYRRALFDHAVTPHVVDVMEPLVRADVDRHLDEVMPAGQADLVADLANAVLAKTNCRLAGIDDDLVPEVRDRAIAMFAARGDPVPFRGNLGAFAECGVPSS